MFSIFLASMFNVSFKKSLNRLAINHDKLYNYINLLIINGFKGGSMKNYLHRWIIEALSYMALGLFGSLIIGLILETLGEQTLLPQLNLTFLSAIGQVAMSMTGAAIGVAIAYGLGAKPLVTFSSVIVGTLGYTTFDGGPVGAYIATVIVVELSRLYACKTKIDIILSPLLTILIGGLIAKAFGPALNQFMTGLGKIIIASTDQQPFIMGILVSVIFGLALTAPISSAALALMLDLNGLAAGAATIGCASQMVGFAVTGYKDNGWGGVLSGRYCCKSQISLNIQ